MVDTVNLQAVTFQRAPLGEGLFAVVTPIGRTPVCVRVCLFRSNVSLKPFPQKVQRYRFASLDTSCDDSAASRDQRFFHKYDRQTLKGHFHTALVATFHSPSSLARQKPLDS